MKLSRRSWMKMAGAAGATVIAGGRQLWAAPPSPSPSLTPFIQPLRFPSTMQPSVSQPTLGGVPYYEMAQTEFWQQVHPMLPPTRMWGYGDASRTSGEVPGPLFDVRKGQPIKVKHYNRLPSQHIFPLDMTLSGMTDRTTGAVLPFSKTVVHLHGAHVAPASDGHPEAWIGPNGERGPKYARDPHQSDIYDYVNDQNAGMLWYHDHALSTTRVNVNAGLAGMYLIRDPWELNLISTGAIPSGVGVGEIPLILQDRVFNADGSLWYPSEYDTDDLGPGPTGTYQPLPAISCVPEFFGDVVLVNGQASPYMDVDPKQYRLRILNASSSRFYHLQLVKSDAQGNTGPTRVAGPVFTQIGADGQFLATPVTLGSPNNPNSLKLYLAPSERADIIVDFSQFAGQNLLLWNDAAAPFPDGDSDNDAPQTRPVLLFKVRNTTPQTAKKIPTLPAITRLQEKSASVVRDIELFEDFDGYGRLLQRLGQNGVAEDFFDIVNINPARGATEVWRFINLTGDTHPIHVHLVNFQVISRQNFDPDQYLQTGKVVFTGPAIAPDPNEAGWKDVIRVNPNQVTKIIATFSAPPEWAYPEGDYMIHCHILEHEDHEMMRRFYLS